MGVCCKGDSHLFQGQREQKVFVDFHFYHKETMKGCHKSISQLLQKEWEWMVFIIRGFYMLQGEMHGRSLF